MLPVITRIPARRPANLQRPDGYLLVSADPVSVIAEPAIIMGGAFSIAELHRWRCRAHRSQDTWHAAAGPVPVDGHRLTGTGRGRSTLARLLQTPAIVILR